jgi:hypothetical protein
MAARQWGRVGFKLRFAGGPVVVKVAAPNLAEDRALLPALVVHPAQRPLCRGTWARVTTDQFRHLALQTR